ncbi:hypothetical protein TMatcc_008143 [Talaromyces marneffei ATCC 18224]
MGTHIDMTRDEIVIVLMAVTAPDGPYGTKRDFLQHKTAHTAPNGIFYHTRRSIRHQTGFLTAPNGSLPTTPLTADLHRMGTLVPARVGVYTSTSWYQSELASVRVGVSRVGVSSSWCQFELVSVRVGVSSSWCQFELVSSRVSINRVGVNRVGVISSWCQFELVSVRVGVSRVTVNLSWELVSIRVSISPVSASTTWCQDGCPV